MYHLDVRSISFLPAELAFPAVTLSAFNMMRKLPYAINSRLLRRPDFLMLSALSAGFIAAAQSLPLQD